MSYPSSGRQSKLITSIPGHPGTKSLTVVSCSLYVLNPTGLPRHIKMHHLWSDVPPLVRQGPPQKQVELLTCGTAGPDNRREALH